MADDRTYIKLHDGMPDHPKIDGLSDKAFRLLIETWCWCSRHLTDGAIPRSTWVKRGTPKTRRELVTAGLIMEAGHELFAHDYLEHQRSAEAVAEIRETKRRAGTLGNHNRWHKPRGVIDQNCPHCVPQGPNGSHDPSHMRSQLRSRMGSQTDRKRSPETETETEIPADLDKGGGHVGRREDSPHPQNPLRCEQHQDHPEDPGPCRGCRDARLREEQLAVLSARNRRIADQARAQAALEARRLAIADCQLCDDRGYRGVLVCHHDPTAISRASNGAARVRAALAKETA